MLDIIAVPHHFILPVQLRHHQVRIISQVFRYFFLVFFINLLCKNLCFIHNQLDRSCEK